MQSSSSRHHYIPRFLINGFTNAQKEVYIYDKYKGRIIDNPRPPKSIFWEKDRNTMIFGENSSSIIEDKTYHKLDNFFADSLEYFKNVDLNKEFIPIKYPIKLHFFILTLHWRIPSTDKIYEQIFESTSEDIPTELKRSSAWKKHQRIYMHIHTLNKINNLNINARFKYRVVEFGEPSFVIGDNPTLFECNPMRYIDLDNLVYLFPLCSERAIIKSPIDFVNEFSKDMERKYAILYNSLIIEQSIRYVASGDKDLLQKSVGLYEKLIFDNKFSSFKENLFKFILI